jgi:hypothetical protein
MTKRTGRLLKPINLNGEGMSASEQVIWDRDITAVPSEGAGQPSEPTSDELWDRIPPAHRHLLKLLLNPDKMSTP